MKTKNLGKLLLGIGLACACSTGALAGTFKNITIDGDVSDWVGVAPAYTDEDGVNNPSGVDFQNVYLANDANYLYIRFTLKQPANPFLGNTYIWLDNDNNSSTGFHPFGNLNFGSSLMIIGDQAYQEAGGGFNEGTLTNGDVAYGAIAVPGTNFEFRISRSVTGVAGAFTGVSLLNNATIEVQLASETGGGDSLPSFANYGALSYTFATPPAVLTTNLPLITLTNNSWRVNQSGTDLGTAWLDLAYDDTQAPWFSGNGLFGYTPAPGAYPAIRTALTSSGQNTYYFRTHFAWNNLANNIAFVVTNYLSDGAVYYLNGAEVRRVRMPAGTVGFATSATSTNSPAGHADIFGIPAGPLVIGDNILEVETHQEASSSSDMVFGLSLTAASQYPVLVVDTNLPADQTVLAGQSVTFISDVIGSGPLSYQWLKNGSSLAGATNVALTIPLVLTNDAGSYSLRTANSLATNTTRAALLTVTNTPVVISDPTQPADQFVVEGRAVTLNAAATGSPLLQYQWFKNSNPIPGATNAFYTIGFPVPTNAGNYSVTISNPASSTNSRTASLVVLLDAIPPAVEGVVASSSQIVVKFSEPVDSTTANNAAHYGLSGGVSVSSAVINPTDSTQVALTTSAPLAFGMVYALTINGVADLFGNVAHATVSFARDITIDGTMDDWTGLTPVYSTGAPSGNSNAADFKDIYVYNDANYYFFRVTLWTDIDPASGQFPYYVNMFFDTDNDPATGYSAIGSDMLVQSGYSYQEKNGTFNDGFGINGLNWLCLPAAPGTNFEFQLSRAATFGQDGTPVFPTNAINFIFQGMTPSFVVENQAPGSGVISYTDANIINVPSLPLGKLAIAPVSGGRAAVTWDPPGTLQYSTRLGGSWTNLPAATSPYVISAAGAGQFFRLSQ